MKIIADNKIPFLKGVFEPFCEISYISGNEINRDCLKGVEVLIVRTRTICNEELLKGSSVKFIATATIGYDHIDVSYCAQNNIKWVNAPGCNSGAVQQWFMAAILKYAKEKEIDLKKKVLGIVGVGNVGKKIVNFADAIEMPVILNDPPREKEEGSCVFRSLETIKRECDIITFHVPLIIEGEYRTYHLANESFIKEVQTGSVLLNSSRGEVLDSDLLELKKKHNAYNYDLLLDVWEGEPGISKEWLEQTHIATPHIAGYSAEGKANGTAMVVQQVGEYLNLPLENWYPADFDQENKKELKIDCSGKNLQAILTEAVLATYKIEQDDSALRKNPEQFESFRSNYNYRNEPVAWLIELSNSTEAIQFALKKIGFGVKQT